MVVAPIRRWGSGDEEAAWSLTKSRACREPALPVLMRNTSPAPRSRNRPTSVYPRATKIAVAALQLIPLLTLWFLPMHRSRAFVPIPAPNARKCPAAVLCPSPGPNDQAGPSGCGRCLAPQGQHRSPPDQGRQQTQTKRRAKYSYHPRVRVTVPIVAITAEQPSLVLRPVGARASERHVEANGLCLFTVCWPVLLVVVCALHKLVIDSIISTPAPADKKARGHDAVLFAEIPRGR